METLAGDDQLRYIDVEGTRVVTSSRCVAEQIKSDKLEIVATGGPKNGEFAKLAKDKKLKSIVMNGARIGNVGKSENSQTDEERKDQNEDKLCKSIIKGLARRNREKYAILAEEGEKKEEEEEEEKEKKKEEGEGDVMCIDDVIGKELLWHGVRKAREQEWKYLRDFGVYENVDEREAIA